MDLIVKEVEKKVGHKVELQRDELGRWTLPLDLIQKHNIDYNGYVSIFLVSQMNKFYFLAASFTARVLAVFPN